MWWERVSLGRILRSWIDGDFPRNGRVYIYSEAKGTSSAKLGKIEAQVVGASKFTSSKMARIKTIVDEKLEDADRHQNLLADQDPFTFSES